ncbi:hypothetical protein KIH39_18995 [Telmatocola sphagniphila]|jgi:hypothetical protein|uniref:Methanolan biosynthesis EpsI domain-containing protein n=1 Tax=Telmatocola sphagniphila TaxID=1123043 RepID=A0A8E6B427_9BACT|nr:hypothetical protein [Telmatocola sphagniphila]QVL30924.1 hypothetical protein KIH39_18995 [Telmatocola sphagniphila]
MIRKPWWITGILLGAVSSLASPALADPPRLIKSSSEKTVTIPVKLPWPVELSAIPETHREAVTKVVQSPTLSALGSSEEFHSDFKSYLWMLDHPERVTLAWRRLGIAAVEIRRTKEGNFTWSDGQGSELVWTCVASNDEGRIWYAEGKARAGALCPVVPVKAVAVLRHKAIRDSQGLSGVRHQTEIFLQTDSKAAVIVTRLLGPAAPRYAEQGAEQVLLFFSGIADYLAKHPEKGPSLLAEKK